MGKIIYLYGETKMYEELIRRLKENGNREYSISEVENIANEILVEGGRENIIGDIPIVKIVEEFGFTPYNESRLKDDVSGNIYIGGTTKDVYGQDNVMVVGKNEVLFHKRFILAHELAHYLFDYLGDVEYTEHPELLFSRAYLKGGHGGDISERRADRFAAELLMPARTFLVLFIRAMEAFSNDKALVVDWLSRYFKTKQSSVLRRIEELNLPF